MSYIYCICFIAPKNIPYIVSQQLGDQKNIYLAYYKLFMLNINIFAWESREFVLWSINIHLFNLYAWDTKVVKSVM